MPQIIKERNVISKNVASEVHYWGGVGGLTKLVLMVRMDRVWPALETHFSIRLWPADDSQEWKGKSLTTEAEEDMLNSLFYPIIFPSTALRSEVCGM